MAVLPIPTKYEGVTFRSRLEARWAVFLTAARIRWQYEYEGFQLPSGWYVPDFWLPDEGISSWLEIKPTLPSPRAQKLCLQLFQATGHRVLLAIGSPGQCEPDSMHLWSSHRPQESEADFGYDDCGYDFCACPVCGRLGVEYCGHMFSERVCAGAHGPIDRKLYPHDDERFINAESTAKSKRFW